MSDSDAQRIFEKLDKLNKELAILASNTTHILNANIDHEKRLRVLEQWQWKVIGIATAVASIASLAVALLAQ